MTVPPNNGMRLPVVRAAPDAEAVSGGQHKQHIITQGENATLAMKTSFILFGPWLQSLVCPVIETDGTPHKKYWGTHTFKVALGKHTIRAWHRWLFFRTCALSDITVDVPDNTTVRLHWSTLMMVVSPGESPRVAAAG